MSRRPDYWDSSKAAEAKRALLASFLDKFISEKSGQGSVRAVETTRVLYVSFQQQFPVLLKERKAVSAGKLIYCLRLAKVVGLVWAIIQNSSVAYCFLKEPVHRLKRAKPYYSTFQQGLLVPSREVQGDQAAGFRQPATIARNTGRKPYHPWPRVLKASRVARCNKRQVVSGKVAQTGSKDKGLITAQSELLPPLVDALQEAQHRDPFIREKQ